MYSMVYTCIMKKWWYPQHELYFRGPLARYAKLRLAHALGLAGTYYPSPRVTNPDMRHDTCVTHVQWCMPRSLTGGFLWSRWRGNVPGNPGACTTRNVSYLIRGPWYDKFMLWILIPRLLINQINLRNIYLNPFKVVVLSHWLFRIKIVIV